MTMQLKPTTTAYSWKTIYQIALEHKKPLVYAHLMAVLATIASVPVPLLMPLLVDEVLLKKPSTVIHTINLVTPVEWHHKEA